MLPYLTHSGTITGIPERIYHAYADIPMDLVEIIAAD